MPYGHMFRRTTTIEKVDEKLRETYPAIPSEVLEEVKRYLVDGKHIGTNFCLNFNMKPLPVTKGDTETKWDWPLLKFDVTTMPSENITVNPGESLRSVLNKLEPYTKYTRWTDEQEKATAQKMINEPGTFNLTWFDVHLFIIKLDETTT